jgi:tetratricopeptide (TPR) repeat protein
MCNVKWQMSENSDIFQFQHFTFHIPGNVGAPRLELGTSALSGLRSNQLSYAPANHFHGTECYHSSPRTMVESHILGCYRRLSKGALGDCGCLGNPDRYGPEIVKNAITPHLNGAQPAGSHAASLHIYKSRQRIPVMSIRTNLMLMSVGFGLLATSAQGAQPTAADALRLSPVQKGVEYDTPAADEVPKCTINYERELNKYVVVDSKGQTLRQFVDSNGDNVVDTWSYFRDGLEVYRDIDSNNNGKADQYRWFNSNGIRWALDQNEDNVIDQWKLISPEEVTEEVVNALATKDPARFKRLLLTADDIKKLGLDAARGEQLTKRVTAASAKFDKVAADPAVAGAQFSDFGGTKPGMVPAGSQGVTKDLLVYESVWAMVQSGEESKQMQLGTLISVGGAWKLIDGPTFGTGEELAGPFFFDPGGRGPGESGTAQVEGNAPTEKMQEVLAELQKLDDKLTAATDAEKKDLNKQRAGLLRQLADMSSEESERLQWLRQMADSVSAATQSNSFDDGVTFLTELEAELVKDGAPEELLAHVEFQRMLAKYYGVVLVDPKLNIATAQEQWMKDLEAFVAKYPKSETSAEALRALAMGYEMSGKTEDALKWYRQILADHPNNVAAPLAKGAVTRLTSEGRPITLQANDVNNQKVDLAALRGKSVVIQYWTTTSDVCVADHAVLKELIAKYGGTNLEVISINLDYDKNQLATYLSAKTLPWKHVYDEGGFDGRLANEMGVVTVPLILLVGPDGKVISSNIQAAEIEGELKKLQVAGVPAAGAR